MAFFHTTTVKSILERWPYYRLSASTDSVGVFSCARARETWLLKQPTTMEPNSGVGRTWRCTFAGGAHIRSIDICHICFSDFCERCKETHGPRVLPLQLPLYHGIMFATTALGKGSFDHVSTGEAWNNSQGQKSFFSRFDVPKAECRKETFPKTFPIAGLWPRRHHPQWLENSSGTKRCLGKDNVCIPLRKCFRKN